MTVELVEGKGSAIKEVLTNEWSALQGKALLWQGKRGSVHMV